MLSNRTPIAPHIAGLLTIRGAERLMSYANEWVLDCRDAGYWVARWHAETYPIGCDKDTAIAVISKLNTMHRPNLELRDGSLFVCRNLHDKCEACEYEMLVEHAV